MTTSILELVTFTLADGKTDAELAATQEGISEFLNEQPGFLYRSISQNDEGSYIDIVYWDNLEKCEKASDAIMQDPRGQAMIALCDMEECIDAAFTYFV